jgi:hypothetical protein
MGYFSNGTEGEMYRRQYCRRCLHGDEDDTGCAVWYAHLMWVGEAGKATVLDALIPRSKDGLVNERCLMFVEVK